MEEYLLRRLSVYRNKVITECQAAGERAINTAHDSQGYNDRSGNLRSSIGYTVLQDGQIVGSKSTARVGGKGKEGASAGMQFARRIAARYPKGIALIVTAGMRYAGFVEAQGRDVLTTAEEQVKRELPARLKELAAKME